MSEVLNGIVNGNLYGNLNVILNNIWQMLSAEMVDKCHNEDVPIDVRRGNKSVSNMEEFVLFWLCSTFKVARNFVLACPWYAFYESNVICPYNALTCPWYDYYESNTVCTNFSLNLSSVHDVILANQILFAQMLPFDRDNQGFVPLS